ncbi:MAG: aminotransferase class IV [Armatimonadetes bacterium]|nr:aminotransferase class IV [Armatimonadota bacterium]
MAGTEVLWLNGDFVAPGEAMVSVDDRGFLFGDGIYEVIGGVGERLFAFDRHWRRLRRSVEQLDIVGVDFDQIEATIREAVRRAQCELTVVYLQITRGAAPRSHAWDPTGLTPTVLIRVREEPQPDPAQAEQGVACLTVPDLRWGRCDIKSLNLLPNVMAKQQARTSGCYEAIFVGADGIVTEGSSSSLAIVSGGELWSHPNGPRILPGVTRELSTILAADLGLTLHERQFDRATMLAADEVILMATSFDILGVTSIDGQTIGTGRPGDVARRLAERFRRAFYGGEF